MRHEYEFIRHIESTAFKLFFVSMTHRLYHWHNDVEILQVVEGSVIVHTAKEHYRLEKNDLFILNANEVHSLSKTEESNTILAIQFDPGFCKSYFPELLRIVFLERHISKTHHSECWQALRSYLYQIVLEYYKKEAYYPLKVMSTLHLLLRCLLQNLPYEDISEKTASTHKKNLDRLNHIILHIKEHYPSKLSLKSLAEMENLDIYYLSHFIKKHLGISFQEYLNKVRFEKALELLRQTDLNHLDICMECGFSDYRYLNAMFQKELGCSPGDYRIYTQKQGMKSIHFAKESFQEETIHSDDSLAKLLKYLEPSTV